jgi:hypothetical protein
VGRGQPYWRGDALTQPNFHGFEALSALDHIEDHGLPFEEPLDARLLKSRDVDKYVLPAAIPSDEAIALVGVEPFHGAGLLDRWRVQDCLSTRPP